MKVANLVPPFQVPCHGAGSAGPVTAEALRGPRNVVRHPATRFRGHATPGMHAQPCGRWMNNSLNRLAPLGIGFYLIKERLNAGQRRESTRGPCGAGSVFPAIRAIGGGVAVRSPSRPGPQAWRDAALRRQQELSALWSGPRCCNRARAGRGRQGNRFEIAQRPRQACPAPARPARSPASKAALPLQAGNTIRGKRHFGAAHPVPPPASPLRATEALGTSVGRPDPATVDQRVRMLSAEGATRLISPAPPPSGLLAISAEPCFGQHFGTESRPRDPARPTRRARSCDCGPRRCSDGYGGGTWFIKVSDVWIAFLHRAAGIYNS